ncbi:threonine-phosphate decarboxylase CobD [Methylocystis parvus]|uniref:threonine-phosphate decarboxylase n=1 Tax=Methylocystis parvus TaxID=134 RepID=A0A6B8M117_9HYPH|nr:threonine-phosphate decarboxylase CobD [Methylocystis parvus]QGM96551.1 threonine-phosphate decarboxylase [Methylocystis parvus]WBJ99597.1 threonine-phosphate decarboxylase CobD [Methylocystis parvus OBBP]
MTVRPSIAHGGRLDEARRLFPAAPQPWIDLSTGVNPHPYPLPPIAPEAWTRLPDDRAFDALEAAARAAYRAPPAAAIVPGAGAQSFIQLLPRVFPARRVAVLGFSYAEHAACWAAAGAKVETVETVEQLASFDAAVIVNPNNPDGRALSSREIAPLAEEMTRKGKLLVVDESFVDFTPTRSVAALTAVSDLIVLRSFGKAYGLAGLRLGFAICAFERAGRLRAALGPWAVSGPALAIGARALGDLRWLQAAAAASAADAARLDSLLERAGFGLVGGTALFRLVRHDKAADWFVRLCEKGILARAFPERPDWLRFGLPAGESAWARLTAALEIA